MLCLAQSSKLQGSTEKMEQQRNILKDNTSDDSCNNSDEVKVHLRRDLGNRQSKDSHRAKVVDDSLRSKAACGGPEGSSSMSTISAAQFQEMVVRALVQTTISLIGSSSGLLHYAGEASIGYPQMTIEDHKPLTTWNETAYHKAEARRKKKPEMMRTSAGEGSDSQEDFPLPENATLEQRALRTRRLNRWRAKRARDLTSNRKAVKKLPYVIHVNGTGKPQGRHRHQWKAAVRGQCGRLDPSMDNINHHPKYIVDSIWHALEKEWEFEGFAHKAREMFEKCATKFMRNRKMQLKYKCRRDVDAPAPNDVSDTHWKKIVDITKKSLKEQTDSTSKQIEVTKKIKTSEDAMEKMPLLPEVEIEQQERKEFDKFVEKSIFVEERSDDNPILCASAQGSFGRSPKCPPLTNDLLASEEEDVDSQIRSLRNQLLWLENSRKAPLALAGDFNDVPLHLTEEKGTMNTMRRVSEAMKENVAPFPVSDQMDSPMYHRSTGKVTEQVLQADAMDGRRKHSVLKETSSGGGKNVREQLSNVNIREIECGDVVSMDAMRHGTEEEIGKGVLIGFAGSKFARKVIPKGWCSVKVSSYTISGGSEACPFPAGWKDQVKQKTVRDAKGRIILWPHSLVHL